jgi:prefoldin beta subunit
MSCQEFATLTPNNVVFKLIGPVLVKQDQVEAKGNVDKRLEFIRGEMSASMDVPGTNYMLT